MSKRKTQRRPRHIRDTVSISEVTTVAYMNEITLVVFGAPRRGEAENRRITLKMQPADAANLILQLREAHEKLTKALTAELAWALGRES